jgi:hypothetical protein
MLFAYVGYRHEANAFYLDGVEVCHDDDHYD